MYTCNEIKQNVDMNNNVIVDLYCPINKKEILGEKSEQLELEQ